MKLVLAIAVILLSASFAEAQCGAARGKAKAGIFARSSSMTRTTTVQQSVSQGRRQGVLSRFKDRERRFQIFRR